MLQRVKPEAGEALEIEILDIGGRRLDHHLKLVVMLEPVGVFAITAIGRPPRGLDIGGFPRFRTQGPQQGGGMEGACPHFHVIRLLQRATLFRPESAEFENDILKIHVLSLGKMRFLG